MNVIATEILIVASTIDKTDKKRNCRSTLQCPISTSTIPIAADITARIITIHNGTFSPVAKSRINQSNRNKKYNAYNTKY